jgi:hypothetical protein
LQQWEKEEKKIKEFDEIMGNLDIGEAMDHLDLDQKDITTRSGGVSSNVHQVCVIITEVVEENKDHLDLDQKDITTRSGGVSSNVHQVCVIITEVVEENNDAGNIVVDTQGNKPRSNSGKEKEKIYVSAGEWRIIMSAINHGTEVPANLRREVLMGYQYTMH